MNNCKNLDELRLILDTELSVSTQALQQSVDDMVSRSASALCRIGQGAVPDEGGFKSLSERIESGIRRVNKAKADLEMFRLVQLMTLDDVTLNGGVEF